VAHDAFLRRALELALTHSRRGMNGPFGAVVVRDGEIVGEGWNRVVETSDPTAHAEILAIREAARTLGTHDLSDCILYASCEPCPMCLSAIYWAHIREIHFAASKEDASAAGFDDGRILRELGLGWEQRSLPSHRALAREGTEVLEAWVRNPRRIPY
jgi:guanine deaminase